MEDAQIKAEKEIQERHRDYCEASPLTRHWSEKKVDCFAQKEGEVAKFYAQKRKEREGI